MKKLILLSAIALLGFASCKKEDIEPNKNVVEFYASGKNLQVNYVNESGLLLYETVSNIEWSKKIETKDLDNVFIGFTLHKDEPSQIVLVQIKVNNTIIKEFKQQHIKGVDDIRGVLKVK